jgi:hypothetical protein
MTHLDCCHALTEHKDVHRLVRRANVSGGLREVLQAERVAGDELMLPPTRSPHLPQDLGAARRGAPKGNHGKACA